MTVFDINKNSIDTTLMHLYKKKRLDLHIIFSTDIGEIGEIVTLNTLEGDVEISVDESNYVMIENYKAAEDYENYMIKVHALKSNSKMIGAGELGKLFEVLENAARTGDVSKIDADTDNVLAMYEALVSRLKPVEEMGDVRAADEISGDVARETAEKLLGALDDFDDDLSKELIKKLSGYPFRITQKNRLKEASNLVDDFMYEEAAEIINEIIPAIKTDFVSSGPACIEKVREKKYDCILLDQMMPGMSGEATLNSMKEQDLLKGTPVIALTADAIIGARESYMEKGFTDYISKPVKYEVLELVLKEYIPREKQLAPSGADELPVVLMWGNDTSALKAEKERLDGIYRCVCALGEKGRDKYLEKHNPDAVMFVKERANITETDDV